MRSSLLRQSDSILDGGVEMVSSCSARLSAQDVEDSIAHGHSFVDLVSLFLAVIDSRRPVV